MSNKYILSIAIIMLYTLPCCTNNKTTEEHISYQSGKEESELISNAQSIKNSSCKSDRLPESIKVDSLNDADIRTVIINEYPMKHYSNKYVSSPYGLIRINDENMVSGFYKWLSEKSGSDYTDSINSRILMEIFSNSDASLSNVGVSICRNDFMNKTDIVLNIYRSGNTELVNNYMSIIGFAFEDYGFDGSPSLNAYIDTLEFHVGSSENLNALKDAIATIKNQQK